MTTYNVVISFVVEGTEKQANKLADKAEDAILASKRLVASPDTGSLVDTNIEPLQ